MEGIEARKRILEVSEPFVTIHEPRGATAGGMMKHDDYLLLTKKVLSVIEIEIEEMENQLKTKFITHHS
mgnify:FL=1